MEDWSERIVRIRKRKHGTTIGNFFANIIRTTSKPKILCSTSKLLDCNVRRECKISKRKTTICTIVKLPAPIAGAKP